MISQSKLMPLNCNSRVRLQMHGLRSNLLDSFLQLKVTMQKAQKGLGAVFDCRMFILLNGGQRPPLNLKNQASLFVLKSF